MNPFKFTKNASVWWPVTVNVPADGGTIEEQQFELRFKRLRQSDTAGIAALSNVAFVLEVAVDWRGVEDDGAPVPFTPDNIAELFEQLSGMAVAVATAWSRFMAAEPEIRQGNSVPSLAGGPDAATAAAGPQVMPVS